MPCIDNYPPSREEILESKVPSPTLCAIIRKHGVAILEDLDHKEAGVELAEMQEWWKNHKKKDDARIKREQRNKKDKEKYQEVMKKLSPQELDIIRHGLLGGE